MALIWATLVAAICVPIALAMTSDLLEGAGQALIYLSNGRLGWLPGLRPTLFHLSLDRTHREDKHGQQGRER